MKKWCLCECRHGLVQALDDNIRALLHGGLMSFHEVQMCSLCLVHNEIYSIPVYYPGYGPYIRYDTLICRRCDYHRFWLSAICYQFLKSKLQLIRRYVTQYVCPLWHFTIIFIAWSHHFRYFAVIFSIIWHSIRYCSDFILTHTVRPAHTHIIRHYILGLKLQHTDSVVHRLVAVPCRKYHVSPVTGGMYSCHKPGCGTVHQHICCKCSIHLLHLGNTVRYEHLRLMHVVKILCLSEIMRIHPIPEVVPGFWNVINILDGFYRLSLVPRHVPRVCTLLYIFFKCFIYIFLHQFFSVT